MLSGHRKIACSVSILLHSSLVMVPFFKRVYKKASENIHKDPVDVATGSCLLPRVSKMGPAKRLSHWSPPACPPLEGCQPCPATWSQSPLEPESFQGNKTALSHI